MNLVLPNPTSTALTIGSMHWLQVGQGNEQGKVQRAGAAASIQRRLTPVHPEAVLVQAPIPIAVQWVAAQ
jgi:hypothetical protein